MRPPRLLFGDLNDQSLIFPAVGTLPVIVMLYVGPVAILIDKMTFAFRFRYEPVDLAIIQLDLRFFFALTDSAGTAEFSLEVAVVVEFTDGRLALSHGEGAVQTGRGESQTVNKRCFAHRAPPCFLQAEQILDVSGMIADGSDKLT
ncbi:MAG: hypothetical protein NWQ45_05670 [Congregibacter sp.]|nr:hypothetical protein [Congregibacter sp.]